MGREHCKMNEGRGFPKEKAIIVIALFLFSIFTSTESAALTVVSKNRGSSPPTVAILDTAIDTSLPIFTNRILFEACITEWYSCPNGSSEMEGGNSATLPVSWYHSFGFSHGTQMSSLAVLTNPEIQIVFIRIIGANSRGIRQITSETTVERALDWVIRNHKRFGIHAVSMSQGHHRLGAPGSNYCPRTPITRKKIIELRESEIPVFFPTGNNGDHLRIDWPACIAESVAIGSSIQKNAGADFSNYDPGLIDFFAPGKARVMSVGKRFINISGTSASTIVAATQWATLKSIFPTLSYEQIYEVLSDTSTNVESKYTFSGKLINLEGALIALNLLANDEKDYLVSPHDEVKSSDNYKMILEKNWS